MEFTDILHTEGHVTVGIHSPCNNNNNNNTSSFPVLNSGQPPITAELSGAALHFSVLLFVLLFD